MKSIDIPMHTRGESIFLDDIQTPGDLLHAAILSSPVAHGRIKRLSIDNALKHEGVVRIITHRDNPGEHQMA